MNKPTLRSQLRQRRKALSPAQRRKAQRTVARHLQRQCWAGQRLAVYAAFGSELDLSPFYRLAQRRRVRLFLPLIRSHRRAEMWFVPMDGAGRWRRHGLGMNEWHAAGAVRPRQLDTVLLPLLGFDGFGGRLGQGGGFYDRAFAFKQRNPMRAPRLLGIGFECQSCPSLPSEMHDIRLDAIVTERGYRRARPVLAPAF